MELSFLASMGIANPPAKRGRSSLEVSRSVDSLQPGGQRPQALPLRSIASWQQEALSGSAAQALGGSSRSRQLQVREGQRRFSAPDPHPSHGALFQVTCGLHSPRPVLDRLARMLLQHAGEGLPPASRIMGNVTHRDVLTAHLSRGL